MPEEKVVGTEHNYTLRFRADLEDGNDPHKIGNKVHDISGIIEKIAEFLVKDIEGIESVDIDFDYDSPIYEDE